MKERQTLEAQRTQRSWLQRTNGNHRGTEITEEHRERICNRGTTVSESVLCETGASLFLPGKEAVLVVKSV